MNAPTVASATVLLVIALAPPIGQRATAMGMKARVAIAGIQQRRISSARAKLHVAAMGYVIPLTRVCAVAAQTDGSGLIVLSCRVHKGGLGLIRLTKTMMPTGGRNARAWEPATPAPGSALAVTDLRVLHVKS